MATEGMIELCPEVDEQTKQTHVKTKRTAKKGL